MNMYYRSLIKRLFSSEALNMSSKGPIETSINDKIRKVLAPEFLEINNDSPDHAHHAAMKNYPITETHFSAYIVSKQFENENSISRHRMVYKILDEEFQKGLHALRLMTFTPAEHAERGKI